MSSIYLRNGVWQIQWKEGTKLRQKSLGTRSKIEARKRKRQFDLDQERRQGLRQDADGTVGELVDAFLAYAKTYYRKDGEPTSSLRNITNALKGLEPYRSMQTQGFTPMLLDQLRQGWVARGLCRTTINQYVQHIRHAFRWGVSRGYVEPTVYGGLTALETLQKGRSNARDERPVPPVDDKIVERTLLFLPPTLKALVRIHRLTGARSSELLRLRPCDIDRSEPVWKASPRHKTEHHGHGRTLYFGARCQAILRPLLLSRSAEEFLFCPREAQVQRRKGLLTFGLPNERASSAYTDVTYCGAIRRACARAKVPRWHPHQLRHTRLTEVRHAKGLEAAQVVGGQKSADVTQIYAERDERLAVQVAAEMG